MGLVSNPVILTLTSINNGTYTFGSTGGSSDPDFPLISRAAAWSRKHEQAPARRKMTIGFNGSFYGNSHADVCASYRTLLSILKDDDISLYYYDGSQVVYNGKLYVNELQEPSSWKQYDGSYAFSGYYFESVNTYSPVSATFLSDQAGSSTYTFIPIPSWGRKMVKNVKSWNQRKTTFAGQKISNVMTVQLDGFVYAINAAVLQGYISILQNAFSYGSGTLTYGSFTNAVNVVSCDIAPDYPGNYADYSITLQYYDPGLHEFSSTRSCSRIHDNPRIVDRPICNARSIRFGMRSGQEITYNVSVKADSVAAARNYLASELNVVVVAGGIEMPGGTESQNDDDNSVAVSIKMFYDNPVIANLFDVTF